MWMNKFKLLCWKNWILVKRHWIQGENRLNFQKIHKIKNLLLFTAFFEILFPIAIVLIFTYARDSFKPTSIPSHSFPSFTLNSPNCVYESNWDRDQIGVIGFSPDDDFHTNLMTGIKEKFKIALVGLKNDDELESWIRNESISNTVVAIQFESTNVSL